ncbi:BirA family transcriptional regulator, biotin operon repressor / biotin-[acetyl-CoA-carboxylase] ligase [Desulforamulus aeronauticus DSM 10349]|uniref:Bifunctional ligase/repressor BirA n=1 Tax=Desulforamulus aeronauticus DSM 10349 TaxID=1121421 RepID=A0A1M6WPA1_9FIRM|nr:BirA family transcriptional regulator, biotin operon repressor / biotin-[acetyl-CoA-carboxylase] ligase [Desulforamulus aeronauticus DSM 10349]
MLKGDKVTLLAKQKILDLLKAEQEYVSGEYICQQLQVSRTAVWKIIEILRKDGYEIEARSRTGYRLVSTPDVLDPAVWLTDLRVSCIGRNSSYHKVLGSTNEKAKELARQRVPEGTVIITEEQTQGKGRLGRAWQCPPKAGLCFSVILYPTVNPMEVAQCTMLAAVAVVRALHNTLGIQAQVKWPNDVYINDCKVCGILAEMTAEADRVKYLVLGIGININQSQADFAAAISTATSLSIQRGHQVSRVQVLKAVLEELDALYLQWQQQGFAPLKDMWRQTALWFGEPVLVSGLQRTWEGILEDIDDSGALILRLPEGGRKTFYSGEVSLRLRKT